MTITLEPGRIKAISLDLDDTLWPIWPVIARAEQALQDWLRPRAPKTAIWLADTEQRMALRRQLIAERPELSHDLRALRQEQIRRALQQHGEDPALVLPAYEVFIAERMRVQLFDDARPALAWLAQRYPLVAVSNGNADVQRIGLGHYFRAGFSAQEFGVGKPDARIFHAAADSVGVAPHEVLHVGDDAALDVVGALGAGLQTVWVNRGGQDWMHAAHRPHATVTDMSELCVLLQHAP
ncbi:MAG: HAD-IA family hydrolase [Hylemonella sp.]|uniref:HAD family hydrolase n=1 Tax=Hylemonella sp. TaxID=2066020 RepID=UPI0022C43EF0|nr:HAD-IA family hydrolase [Hylemonella sp.]MCZ8251878.1 HAD-IA family hydrolase [Hylemonella sp.]